VNKKMIKALFALAVTGAACLSSSGAQAKQHSTNFQYEMGGSAYRFKLGDATGDGLAELILYGKTEAPTGDLNVSQPSGYYISVLTNDYAMRKIAGTSVYSPGESPTTVFTMHKTSGARESVCAFTNFGNLRCYGVSPYSASLVLESSQALPAGWTTGSKVAVGDFNGTGQDQVLVYSPWDGSSMHVFQFNGWGFAESSESSLGNLTGLSWPGGIQVFVANVQNNADDGGRRDDVVLFNQTSGQIAAVVSHRDPSAYGKSTFWWWYTSPPMVASNEELTVPDLDGDGLEDIAIHGVDTGALQFFWSQPDATGRPIPKVQARGQLSTDGPSRLVWGLMKSFPGEAGNTNTRDDAFYYEQTSGVLERFDARWDGAARTYWWAYNKGAADVVAAAR